jgi:AraC-like DNA-binding protein
LPFGVKIVGHFHLQPPTRKMTDAIKDFVQVIWCLQGSGILLMHGKAHPLRPNQVGVYLPGTRHEFYPVTAGWECRWWAVDGPLAAVVASALGLAAGVHDAGEAPLATFRLLEKALRNPSLSAEREASALAYRLGVLATLGSQTNPGDEQVREAVRILDGEWTRPQLSVKQLADRLNLHRSELSRRFKAVMGITPMAYLTRLRIQNALVLLRTTRHSIADVAKQCAYDDPNYFARLLRHHIGSSPLQFRQDHGPRQP